MRDFINQFAVDESGASVVEGIILIGVAATIAIAFGVAVIPRLKNASKKMGETIERSSNEVSGNVRGRLPKPN